MVNVMLKILDGFFFGMSSVVPASLKSPFLY